MKYQDLQKALKIARTQGLTTIRLNSKKIELEKEYARIRAIANPAPEEDPAPTVSSRREILLQLVESLTEQGIDALWQKVMGSNPADAIAEQETPAPEPETTPEPSPEAEPERLGAIAESAPEVTPEPAPVTDEQVLATIKEIDTELGTKNYLPIYHLRNAYPQVKRADMDAILHSLERQGKLDMSLVQEVTAYTQEQLDQGIRVNPEIQDHVANNFFFLMVN